MFEAMMKSKSFKTTPVVVNSFGYIMNSRVSKVEGVIEQEDQQELFSDDDLTNAILEATCQKKPVLNSTHPKEW